MKKFDRRVKIGTKVKINDKYYTVSEIHESRQWINVAGLIGSFQVGHIKKFTNRKESNNA